MYRSPHGIDHLPSAGSDARQDARAVPDAGPSRRRHRHRRRHRRAVYSTSRSACGISATSKRGSARSSTSRATRCRTCSKSSGRWRGFEARSTNSRNASGSGTARSRCRRSPFQLHEPRPAIVGEGGGVVGTLKSAFGQLGENLVETIAWLIASLGVIVPAILALWIAWRLWRALRSRRGRTRKPAA